MKSFPDLSDPVWTSDLACDLMQTAMAIARLDTRFSLSFVAPAWRRRARWAGHARALQAQGEEIEEIDIFLHHSGLSLPDRPHRPTVRVPALDLPDRPARSGAHWAEDLPFAFDPPPGWGERATPLRALELQARWARTDPDEAAWLRLPDLLHRLGMTRTALPNLVVGDKALRLNPRDRDRIVPRYLRALRHAAEDGLDQIDALERDHRRVIDTLAAEHRPGKLAALCAWMMTTPFVSPRRAADRLGLTLSGAGKLLDRAAALGLCHEISGRQVWRLYLAPDLAVRYGFVKARRGRPPIPEPLPATGPLADLLAAFDAEMAAFDRASGTADADGDLDIDRP